MKNYTLIFALGALCGCTSQWDMQGTDPKDYYAAHPIENKVESRTLSQTLRFSHDQEMLSPAQYDVLHAALHDISPDAADSVRIVLPALAACDEGRRTSLLRTMHSMGYDKNKVHVEMSKAVARDTVQIDVNYLVVVPPRCPDWRTSPVTSYSNTQQGNFECSQQVNMGLMVADPHDLIRGTGDVYPDTQRSSKAIDDYHAGRDFSQSAQQGSSGSGSSSGSSQNGNPASGGASAVASGVSGLTGGGSAPQ